MTGPKSKSARNIALAVLNRFNPERNYAAPILNKLLKQTNEKQRATDLVFGTIRNRRAIDMVITRFTARPVKRIPAKTLNVIRIAVYELVYCPATAEYSIVNDAVENSKSVGGKKQAGFVNAALRQVARQIKNRQANLLNACPTKTLPQTLSNGCEFLAALLPEPKIKIVEYLSSVFSLPEWLIAGWVADFGAEKTREICFASNRKTSIYPTG
jgi:16S rRNA (cytosine967-C5)-methyltransferase